MGYIKLNISQNMRAKVLLPALLATVFAAPSMATDQYNDTARVISATPQTERVNVPRQECRTEYQQQSYNNGGDRSIAGAVIGGIAGGLLGNTIGRGKGRIAAAAVGAGVGAIAGDRIGNQNNHGVGTRSVPVQSCYQVDNWQTVNSGYLVAYEYNGRNYTTVTNSHPGRYIDVNVAVSPDSRAVTKIGYIEQNQYNDSSWDDENERRGHGKHRGWGRHHEGRYY
ncbi:MAG: glycine zipper 2TM domain-containing protein [Methylotenera sp.]|nr:glycine zipper 2TM domain-containing protein [Methylotenera sp.]